ncbi:cell division protein PerM [Yinghuangia soli]|uniref:DUF6350 family protein n=1 Tax=Yinghuangia soli TaxID=2908204 RepID=A0AA41Q3G1_9ACTN|nr:DUF6350 family protein [Yinghuangia soli]MCF2530031.1 DUF6350 family protein [Yinghuangia soli]
MSDTPVPALPAHPAAAEPVQLHDRIGPAAAASDASPEAASQTPPEAPVDASPEARAEEPDEIPGEVPDPARAERNADLRATLDGAFAGLTAAGLGLGIAVAPVLAAVLADAFGGGFTDPGDILRTAGQVWCAAQRVGLDVAGEAPGAAVRLGIVPLGVTVLLVLVLVRAGRRCAAAAAAADGRPGPAGGARSVTIALAACTAVYAALAYGIAVVSGTPAIQPVRERAPVAAGLFALVFAAYGALRAGAYRELPDRMPRQWADRLRPFAAPARTALRAGAAGACVLAAGGAVIVCAALVVHAGEVGALLDRVATGTPDALAVALLCVALMPNAVMCAVAYASCAGFMVGVGTTVAPAEVTLGAVPALPLFGALPAAAPAYGWAALAVPAAAGIAAGLLAARGGQAGRLWTAVGSAAGAGAVTGLLAGVAAWMATGAAGANRLTRIGPHVAATAGAVAAEVAVAAMLTAAAAGWWRWRGVRAAACLETVAVPVPEQATR